jgi:hypothetical protein
MLHHASIAQKYTTNIQKMGMMVWKLATKIRSRALKGLKYFPNRAPN